MSEPIAEAFVLIRPNLSVFSAELQAGLAASIKTASATSAVTTAATVSQRSFGTAIKSTTKTLQDQSVVAGQAARDIDRFSRGIAATGLSLFGLRGATLAASGAFLVGAASVTAFAKAVGAAVGFQRQLSVFAATTGATAAQLTQVKEAAIALGADLSLPGVSASDAAQAMTELAKAGLSVQDAIAGARGVLQLGTAAGINFEQATNLAANALNAFSLSGSKATVVADTLANAANAAQGSIVDIGVAFGQAAAVGHQVGLSFQDTTVFLTALARAGLTSSDAGTSLRTALIRLINPTKKAKEIFHEFGIAVRDSQGNLRPEFFTNLGIALDKLTKKQRDAALAQIGGQDAIRALSILSKLSVRDLVALRDELSKQGTAAELARARTTGLAGAGQNLSNTIENLSISLGSKATPSLTAFTNGLTNAVQAIAASPLTGTIGQAIGGIASGFDQLVRSAAALPPVLAPIVALLANIANVIGPDKILTVAVAFVTLRKVLDSLALSRILVTLGAIATTLKSTGLAVTQFAQLARGVGAIGTLQVLGRGAAESLGALALRAATSQLAVAGLAATVFILATRESATERATRHLTDAVRGLVDAEAKLTGSRDALASAQSSARTDKLAVSTAKLAEQQARLDLANSNAAGGSFARAQLEDRLAVAVDSVRLAEKQAALTRKAVSDATLVANQAEDNRQLLVGQTTAALVETAKAESNLASARASLHFKDPELAGRHAANQAIIDDLNKQAQAQRLLGSVESIQNAQRLEALTKLVSRTKDFATTSFLIFNAKTVDAGLAAVERQFQAAGDRSGSAFVEALRIKLNPEFLADIIRVALQRLIAALAGAGTLGGVELATGIARGFAARSAAILAEVQAALAHAVTVASNQTDTLLARVTRVQVGGGSLQAQLAAAAAARARAQTELNRADEAVRISTGGKKRASAEAAQKKALGDLSTADSEVRSLQAQILSDAKSAAEKLKADAAAAQKKLDDADQAFLTAMSFRQGQLFDIRATRAERTKSLADDIALQVDEEAFFTRMIAVARRTIHSAATLATTLQQLRLAREQAITQEKALEQARRDQIKQAIIDKRDRREESLGLDIQIAQTNHNAAQELKAHQALLKYLLARQKHSDRGTLEWKRLQAKIATEQQAIKDLRKQTQARADEFKALAFTFLQTQQGFAANLLGNLLPTAVSAGTVTGGGGGRAFSSASGGGGGGIIDTAVSVPTASFPTGPDRPPDVGGGLGRASAVAAQRGASQGQMAALIQINRAMLRALTILAGRGTHPEASHQKMTAGQEWNGPH